MSNLSTATRYLASATPNPALVDLNAEPTQPFRNQDNAELLAAVATRLAGTAPPKSPKAPGTAGSKKTTQGAVPQIATDGVLSIGLIGEYGPLGYALRRSQEVIRFDKTASYWSSAFLFLDPISTDPNINRDPKRAPRILEASLHPPHASSVLFSLRNGVSVRRFSDYATASFDLLSRLATPNFAVLCIGLTDAERKAILAAALRPEFDPMHYDLTHLLGTWFDYATNLGKRSNPLLEGLATPSVSFLQLAFDAAGIDLCAGASDRNMAPEHLWQSARFLYSMFETRNTDGTSERRPVIGFYGVREKNCLLAPADIELPRTFEDYIAMHRASV